MARTESTMLALNTLAADFKLLNPCNDKHVSFADCEGGKGTLVMFICNHCPFVKHVHDELIQLATDYQAKGIAFIAINANDIQSYPADAPDKMKEMGYPFPYLFDATQETAKAYQAACTPDFYVFDQGLKCVYRGQLDDSRPGNNIPVTGHDVRAALDAVLAGKAVNPDQKPSIGCNIKWK